MAGLSSENTRSGIPFMGKAMSIGAMVVAGLLAFLFAFDLILAFPFGGAQPLMDIGFIVCALILGYLSWSALRDNR